jgi:hypothetical protein
MRDTKFMTSDSLKQAHSLHIYVVSGMEGNSGVEPGVGLSSGDELLPQPTGPKLTPAASGRGAAIRALERISLSLNRMGIPILVFV